MEFVTYSHQFAQEVLDTPARRPLMDEIVDVLTEITDEDLMSTFRLTSTGMSLSKSINALIRRGLVARGWTPEPPIFQSSAYQDKRWRLDFAKESVSVEVAFNHGEAIAWNLLKPVLASQLNHVQKAITTEVGVIICATKSLKAAGLFDKAVGEYEKFLRYLTPLQAVLPTPLLIVGLQSPRSFTIRGSKVGSTTVGRIEVIGDPPGSSSQGS